MNEQRRTDRVSLDCPIDQLVVCPPNVSGRCEELFVVARALNVSAEGLAGESRTAIDPLMRIYLIIQLPDGPRIQCDTYVAHSRMEGGLCRFGLHFVDLDASLKTELVQYLKSKGSRVEQS